LEDTLLLVETVDTILCFPLLHLKLGCWAQRPLF